MQVDLTPITRDNVRAVCDLTVHPSQERFVASAAVSLAQAYVSPEARPFALRTGDTLVGFAMMEDEPNASEVCLWRFLIDHRHQGRGYGSAAIGALIAWARARPGTDRFVLGVVQGEGSPQPFYERLGFVATGEIHEGEVVMALAL